MVKMHKIFKKTINDFSPINEELNCTNYTIFPPSGCSLPNFSLISE